jgi:CBS domain-containing protein
LPVVSTVKEIATPKIISVESEETVRAAAGLMSEKNIGCLMVTQSGKPAGIVTERDILRKVTAGGRDPASTRVKAVMSSPLIVIDGKASLADATLLMIERKIRHLFVSEGGRIVGIFTDRDVERQVFEIFSTLGNL